MRTTMRFALGLSLLLSFLAETSGQGSGQEKLYQCNLNYDPSWEEGCRIYGNFGGELVGWERGDDLCLRDANISEIDLTIRQVLLACPDRNGTNSSITSIVNIFRDDTPLANELRSKFDEWFVLDPLDNGTDGSAHYILRDSIVSRTGQTVSCTDSDRFCYEVINQYFGTEARGKQDIPYLCGIVHDDHIRDQRLEQSMLRLVLCNNQTDSTSCEPLLSQIQGQKSMAGGSCNGIDDIPNPGSVNVPFFSATDPDQPTSGQARSMIRIVVALASVLFALVV